MCVIGPTEMMSFTACHWTRQTLGSAPSAAWHVGEFLECRNCVH